ncbi:B3 domain-containing transcription factor ABI3 [Carex littledalei]|uniref:B3 domain-containing transcription factor ABI3 n=1 Tax=Carex littledalei TaxID=544730 RepID=A0A833R507_9POAL|nr:B3 domain-containing transcription factor ABI3 [Carex littledalei]
MASWYNIELPLYLIIGKDSPEVGPKLVIQKVLCRTDISRRLVLSKNEAEANMPSLAANEARPMHLYDKLTGRFWEFIYRCWESPNRKVRSYYIENTGEYFRRHGLRPNDIIIIHEEETGIQTIRFRRAHAPICNNRRFREPFHSLMEDIRWAKRPRYSEIFPILLDDTRLDQSGQPAMEPIPSPDEPTTSLDHDCM